MGKGVETSEQDGKDSPIEDRARKRERKGGEEAWQKASISVVTFSGYATQGLTVESLRIIGLREIQGR